MMILAYLISLLSIAWADPEAPSVEEGDSPPADESAPADGAEPTPKEEPGAAEEETSPGTEEASPDGDPTPPAGEESATEGEETPTEGGEAPTEGEEASTGGEESSPEETTEAPPADLTPEELEGATTAPQVDKKFIEFLRPTREKLPQVPYGNTEYTAYALEFGQIRFGVNQTALGIAPRVQLGTAPALDATGIYNGSVKVNAIHTDSLDLAIQSAYYTLDAGLGFDWIRGGAIGSLRLTEPWSLHLGSSFDRLTIDGLPEFARVADLLIQGSAETLEAWQTKANEEGIELHGNQSMVTVRMATDYRFNRRDALVLQGSAIIWSAADWGVDGLDPEAIPPVLNLDQVLFDESDFKQSVAGSYVASLAYQRTRKHMDMRFGLGISAVKYAWLLQTFELSYHFGGKTRREETQLKRDWKRNKRIDG